MGLSWCVIYQAHIIMNDRPQLFTIDRAKNSLKIFPRHHHRFVTEYFPIDSALDTSLTMATLGFWSHQSTRIEGENELDTSESPLLSSAELVRM